jgi:hypothetical protein
VARLRVCVVLALAVAGLVASVGAWSARSAKLPCTFKFARPAAKKLSIKISNCTAPDVIDVRFQFNAKTSITHATPFKVKFTTCKVVHRNIWDCHFGGGLPSGTDKAATATLALVSIGSELRDGYVVVFVTFSDGKVKKDVLRLPI